MSWINWTCLGLLLSGLVVFLCGANFYNAVIGWAGVGLFTAGILVFLIKYVYDALTKEVDMDIQDS